jgi:hypothetical protein
MSNQWSILRDVAQSGWVNLGRLRFQWATRRGPKRGQLPPLWWPARLSLRARTLRLGRWSCRAYWW